MKSGGHSYKSMTLVYVSLARTMKPAVSVINHAVIGCRPSCACIRPHRHTEVWRRGGVALVQESLVMTQHCCTPRWPWFHDGGRKLSTSLWLKGSRWTQFRSELLRQRRTLKMDRNTQELFYKQQHFCKHRFFWLDQRQQSASHKRSTQRSRDGVILWLFIDL